MKLKGLSDKSISKIAEVVGSDSDKQKLVQRVEKLWLKYSRGGRPTEREKELFREAYYENSLPNDPDYNVYQWVEDGFPNL